MQIMHYEKNALKSCSNKIIRQKINCLIPLIPEVKNN